MNGMRIKSHKSYYNENRNNNSEKYTRYTPLGTIRLLPPVTAAASQNITVVAVSATAKTAKKASTKKRAKTTVATRARNKTKSKK